MREEKTGRDTRKLAAMISRSKLQGPALTQPQPSLIVPLAISSQSNVGGVESFTPEARFTVRPQDTSVPGVRRLDTLRRSAGQTQRRGDPSSRNQGWKKPGFFRKNPLGRV